MSGHNWLLSHQILQESKKLLMCYIIKTPRTLLYTIVVIAQAILIYTVKSFDVWLQWDRKYIASYPIHFHSPGFY